jgi:hypothetical protein
VFHCVFPSWGKGENIMLYRDKYKINPCGLSNLQLRIILLYYFHITNFFMVSSNIRTWSGPKYFS